MRYNSAQKAQQALTELTKEGPLEERLHNALGHLTMAGGRNYAEDSSEIIEAYQKATNGARCNNLDTLATGIREMIEAIFTEEGANEVRSKLGDRPT